MASTLTIATLDGATTQLGADAAPGLAARLGGGLLTAADAPFETARRVWNGNIDRRPALIARCTTVADVQAAVGFARDNGLWTAIRGGAHNAAGHGTCEGGLLIDSSPMKAITVDAAGRTARAEPGVLWGEFDAATTAHGLATTGGTVTNTGIAGLTLGGGLGWLMGVHGLTIDNLLSVGIVTADAQALTASESQNADLFWALRGGGGNFGVVTLFEYRLHPIANEVLGGMVIFPLEQARDVLRFYREFSAALPDQAECHAALLTAPGGPPVVAVMAGYNGPIADGEKFFAPLRAFGQPLQDVVGPMPYSARQSLLDAPNAIHGLQRYWKSGFTTVLSDELIDVAVEAAGRATSPLSAQLFFRLHGAATRVPAEATAFGLRAEQWDVNVIGQWEGAEGSADHIAWAKAAWSEYEPRISGSAYVNHLAADDSLEKVRASYGPGLGRLQQVKARYDPKNMFRVNANITPAS